MLSPFKKENLFLKYPEATRNLKKIKEGGAVFIGGVDATKMIAGERGLKVAYNSVVFAVPAAEITDYSQDRSKENETLLCGFFKHSRAMIEPQRRIILVVPTDPTPRWNTYYGIDEIASRFHLRLDQVIDLPSSLSHTPRGRGLEAP